MLQMLKGQHVGTILGEPTAGTNGDLTIYDTIGRLKIIYTGLRVLNPDRTLLHGHGITPDVVVHPSIEGLVSGKDEMLEAAVRLATGS
jgi:C-terminal processing protease CtpA/Prc